MPNLRIAFRSSAVPFLAAALLLAPACGDGPGAVGSPRPTLTGLGVSEVARGAAAETITVTGTGFVAESVVRFDDADRPTEYVGPTRLRVVSGRDDFREAGSVEVTVYNPPPGGGSSNGLPLDVVSPVVALGDTVAEELTADSAGIREFRIAGRAGDEWIVFLQASPRVDLIVVDSAAHERVASVGAHGPTTELEELSTRRFVLPRTGTYLVHVHHSEVATGYRFRIDAVDRSPEGSSGAIAIGAVASEAIGSVGDVDEYTFAGAAGQEVNLLVRLESGMADGLLVHLMHGSALLRQVELTTPTASLDDAGTGRLALPADADYTVRVFGAQSGTRADATGRYALELYGVDPRPEQGGVVRLDGPAVAGEIERPGDVDEWELAGSAGQRVVIHLTTPGTTGGGLVADLRSEVDDVVTAAVTSGADYDAGLGYSFRRTLPRSGTYRLRVRAVGPSPLARGGYAVAVYTVSAEPETVPARIAIGDTVRGEAIDRPGDLDVFTFQGEAGREVTIFLGTPDPSGLLGHVGAPDAGAPTIFVAAGTPSLDGVSTGRFTLNDETYHVTVDGHLARSGNDTGFRGEYALRVFPIDRRPEGRAAPYVPGDTVAGEPLYPAGDVDEYTFSLDRETTFAIHWEAAGDALGSGAASGLLFDESTGRNVWNDFALIDGDPWRRVTLPAGRYRMSVLVRGGGVGGSPWRSRPPTLSYAFALVPE